MNFYDELSEIENEKITILPTAEAFNRETYPYVYSEYVLIKDFIMSKPFQYGFASLLQKQKILNINRAALKTRNLNFVIDRIGFHLSSRYLIESNIHGVYNKASVALAAQKRLYEYHPPKKTAIHLLLRRNGFISTHRNVYFISTVQASDVFNILDNASEKFIASVNKDYFQINLFNHYPSQYSLSTYQNRIKIKIKT